MQSSGAKGGVAHGGLSKGAAAHSRLSQDGGTHDGSHCVEMWWCLKCRDDLNPSVAEKGTRRAMEGQAARRIADSFACYLRATIGRGRVSIDSPSGCEAGCRKVEVVWRMWFPCWAFWPGIAEDL